MVSPSINYNFGKQLLTAPNMVTDFSLFVLIYALSGCSSDYQVRILRGVDHREVDDSSKNMTGLFYIIRLTSFLAKFSRSCLRKFNDRLLALYAIFVR